MATNIVDLEQVPPDIDDMAVGVLTNPLFEDFTHEYGGRPLTVPASTKKIVKKKVDVEKQVENKKTGEMETVIEKVEQESEVVDKVGKKEFPLYVAVHLGKHLAEKIIRKEFRDRIALITDAKEKELESAKPIPDYKGKIWEKMKELIETESDFFDEKGLGKDGEKEKFLR